MNTANPAPEYSPSRSSMVLRVDRFALKAIVKDEGIIAALVETHFSINGIYNTDLLLECLLERIFDLVPNVGGGVVLFAAQRPEQLDPVAIGEQDPRAVGQDS